MKRALATVLFLTFALIGRAQDIPRGAATHSRPNSPDLTTQPTLYVVGYAHLDTQWRWEYPQVIREYLPSTMYDNFALFEKYPHYIFNFSGANRYRMMKEYYPADYQKLRQYVAAGRWFPAGSSMEESDVNSPSAESILRQVLYGNRFFRRDFGKASAEYMLPDCFGFPSSLPSILAHAGIKGFSTQKLTWHSAAPVGGENSPEHTPTGIPFNVGFWEGPDGKGVIAALNPGSYGSNINEDLSKSESWIKRVQLNGQVSGLFTDYHYYGVGDIGGAPREPSVKLLEAIVTRGTTVLPPAPVRGDEEALPPRSGPEVQVGDGPLRVISSAAEQMFLDIKPEPRARLPRYQGDLELIEHSSGSLTSEAYHKRGNRKNEMLPDAAERASVAAQWLGGRPYPLARLNHAWTLVMGGQFHDIQAGTATPRSYEYSWNDDVLAMNQFAGALTSASEAIASGLNTQAKGTAIVVYNPLSIAREDVVEANISFPGGAPKGVRVLGPDNKTVPAQLAGSSAEGTKVLFLAKVPAVSFAVYDIQPAEVSASPPASALHITESSLENARYRIRVDQNGDVASILDKSAGRELLSAPARLAFQYEKPSQWPAWNMDWADQQKPPRAYVQGPARVRITESGPARVALEIEREAEGSKFVQTIRLSAGEAGNRVEFWNAIDWKTGESALKATFPLTASSPEATYNWEVGTIQRGNNHEKKYEMPSHQWFDLTDKSGAYGVTVLSDCKYGSDKPDDNTLRLTLIYSPGISEHGRPYGDQATQDWGHHEFVYGLAGHAGDWRREQTDWQALRLNQPLIAFWSARHAGTLGRSFSLLHLNHDRVRVMALKKSEDGNEVIVRLVEIDGQPQANVHIVFAAPIESAREVNGQEMPLLEKAEAKAKATVARGELVTSFSPYQLRSFAVKLAGPPSKLATPQSQPLSLPYDLSVASLEGTKAASGFDAAGRNLPAEMLPRGIDYDGIRFHLAPANEGKPNALVARGQTIPLPAGQFNRLYLLAASAEGDQKATFGAGENRVDLTIQDWGGFIGQWDTRMWNKKEEILPPRPGSPPGASSRKRTVLEYTGLTPGFIKRAPVAWFASHHHTADGANEPYSYSYLFAYPIDLPSGATMLTLPDNDKIRILAITGAQKSGQLRPAHPLYDTLERTGKIPTR